MAVSVKKSSETRWRDCGGIRGLVRFRQGYGATRCCAQLGAYIRFCETSPPFSGEIYDVTFTAYGNSAGKPERNSVGSVWKTNPNIGVFCRVSCNGNGISAAFQSRFTAFAEAATQRPGDGKRSVAPPAR